MKFPPLSCPLCPIAVAVLLLFSTVAGAQFPGTGGGRQRGAGEKAMQRGTTDKAASHGAISTDPLAAIFRELPSLKVDMKITGEQAPAWDAFASGVREANNAAINRARRAAMARPRDDAKPDPSDAPTALQMFSTFAEEDAQRAETMLHVKDKVAMLVALLTPEQRRMFDRRIAQAQFEPLSNF